MACASAQLVSSSQRLLGAQAIPSSLSESAHVTRHAAASTSQRRVRPCRAEAAKAFTPASDGDVSRRSLLLAVSAAPAALALSLSLSPEAMAAPRTTLPTESEEELKLCSAECEATLDDIPLKTTASGLQYRDIVVGRGPSPPVGFQVAADYVAMVPSGKIFASSLEKGMPYIFRVGSGQVVAGLDEGILTMKVGGLRRLYIPGELAFPKGLASAPGRPRVLPNAPVVFDVKLAYVPGLEEDEEE
ncbi:hypothetical protein CLOM_g24635 [Closterium sp. NIES-68]|nr:hypothetical protein CLOM_g24635 [Closterium sp. NIES-68]GJP66234.1 hypothetical protein CLOP_g23131 [Closterium sp. NIES-67]